MDQLPLRHRVLLSYDALAEGIDADQIVQRVLATTPAPRVTVKDPNQGARDAAPADHPPVMPAAVDESGEPPRWASA